jgi:hypothetical protein
LLAQSAYSSNFSPLTLASHRIVAAQYSQKRDLRHLKALVLTVTVLVFSSTLSLTKWEAHITSWAQQAQGDDREKP